MKTLADFKRTITVSTYVEYVKCEERTYNSETGRYDGEFYTLPVPEKVAGRRYVSYVDTTGFYLKRSDDKSAKGSFCGWPKASQLEFDGESFTITETTNKGDAYQKRTYKIIKL